eukprot:m.211265 g.211265  ORF g.211265 m.211265 type:complete len:414 (-) comp18033_c0_seq1:322-1563(-)
MADSSKKSRKEWHVMASVAAKRTANPIRQIVDNINQTGNPNKEMIRLSIGDPTVYGNLPVAESVKDALIASIQSGKFNGYPPSTGYADARKAIAEYSSEPDAPVKFEDVVIASGCSGALELAIASIANEGQNILIPAPGFSLYKTLATSRGIETRSYRLLPKRGWEVDLEHLESLADDNTVAILVNNPSNPCGSVYTADHLRDIVALADKLKIPIIADEIYAHMNFKGKPFVSMASVSKTVPIVSCGGLAKRYLAPGWRVGWVVVHDRGDALGEIRTGLERLSQCILGANSIVQGALREILLNTKQEVYDGVMQQIEASAQVCFDLLSKVPCLTPIMPQGAMYMMVGVDFSKLKGVTNDREFCQLLLDEQSVFCLPASIFESPNFFRIVTTVPKDKVQVAVERIAEFCQAHAA